MSMLQLKFFM